MNELSNMDGTLNAAASENTTRWSMATSVPGLSSCTASAQPLSCCPPVRINRRPTGQRGALLWFRTGSDVVIPNAFRLLSIRTTAYTRASHGVGSTTARSGHPRPSKFQQICTSAIGRFIQ